MLSSLHRQETCLGLVPIELLNVVNSKISGFTNNLFSQEELVWLMDNHQTFSCLGADDNSCYMENYRYNLDEEDYLWVKYRARIMKEGFYLD